MTEKLNKTVYIVDGPSREQLFDALRLCDSKDEKITRLVFTLTAEQGDHATTRFDCTVLGIKRAKRSGQSWLIELEEKIQPGIVGTLEGFYDSKTRKGTLYGSL